MSFLGSLQQSDLAPLNKLIRVSEALLQMGTNVECAIAMSYNVLRKFAVEGYPSWFRKLR